MLQRLHEPDVPFHSKRLAAIQVAARRSRLPRCKFLNLSHLYYRVHSIPHLARTRTYSHVNCHSGVRIITEHYRSIAVSFRPHSIYIFASICLCSDFLYLHSIQTSKHSQHNNNNNFNNNSKQQTTYSPTLLNTQQGKQSDTENPICGILRIIAARFSLNPATPH